MSKSVVILYRFFDGFVVVVLLAVVIVVVVVVVVDQCSTHDQFPGRIESQMRSSFPVFLQLQHTSFDIVRVRTGKTIAAYLTLEFGSEASL